MDGPAHGRHIPRIASTPTIHHTGPAPGDIFDIPFTSVSSFVLLMSSLTMVLALSALNRGDIRNNRLWLLTTALLGSLFIGGQVYEFTITVGVTANLFRKGHRIRLDIASANFPRFDRNPNTGSVFGEDADLRVARQRVYHDRAYASHVILPVIPGI